MAELANANVGKEMILNAPLEKLGKSFLEELFAGYHDRETNQFKDPNFKTNAAIVLTKKEYQWVKEDRVNTTLGQLFFNRFMFEKTGLIQHLGYTVIVMTEDGFNELDAKINSLVMNDTITTKELGLYIDARDRLGFWCAAFLSVSITTSLISPMDNVKKRREELFKQYENELKSKNAVTQIMTASEIQKELVDMTKENLSKDIGFDLYNSGAGNLKNNYKNINVMVGPVWNEGTKQYDIVKSSLMDGIQKQDISAFANNVVAAAYPSAVGTAEAGYMAKIVLALLQSEELDPNPESDCGTKMTIPVTINKKMDKYFLYRYIDENGKQVMLTPENVKSYVGKRVNLYSPQCCLQTKICGKCAGKVFYNLGTTNVGMLSTIFTQKLLNLKLKSKHDLSQSAGIIPEEKVFLDDMSQYFEIKDGNLINKTKVRFFIPRLLEELAGFYKEATEIECMGVFVIKVYDNNDHELATTRMTVPAMINLHLYGEVQEDPDNYIVMYEPESEICSLGIQQTYKNVEKFINLIYLNSKSPQIPYHLLTDSMWICQDINKTDLTGISLVYELLGRRVCRKNGKPFAMYYGKGNVDPMDYDKLPFRRAVQEAGATQSFLFQDVSGSVRVNLAAAVNGKSQDETPLDKVMRA